MARLAEHQPLKEFRPFDNLWQGRRPRMPFCGRTPSVGGGTAAFRRRIAAELDRFESACGSVPGIGSYSLGVASNVGMAEAEIFLTRNTS